MNKMKFAILLGSAFAALAAAALPGDCHVWFKFRRTGEKPEGWTPPGRERFWGQWNDLNFERKDGKNLIILNSRYQPSLPDLVNPDGTLKLTAPEGYEYGGDYEADMSASLPGVPQLEVMSFNNPEATVPVGVGLTCCPVVWDFDGDGVDDILLSCECRRWNNTHFFRNLGKKGEAMPVFDKGVNVGVSGRYPVQTSFNGERFLAAGRYVYRGFETNVFKFATPYEQLPEVREKGGINEITFTYRDFDGDGKDELVISGDIWHNIRWDDAYSDHGVWTGGHLKGWTWIAKNRGGDQRLWECPEKLLDVKGDPLTTDGPPRAMFEDFDGDGDLDMIGGSFYNEFTYFENVGSRTSPKYAPGRKLADETGRELVVDSPLMTPVSFDWNRDGKADIICGDEAGYVSYIENAGRVKNGSPVFKTPRYFRQRAYILKYGVLSTPAAVDWDGDGDLDFIAGNAAGYIGFIENLSGPGVEKPKFAAPVELSCELPTDPKLRHPDVTNRKHTLISLDPFRVLAGPAGSIQGPRERMWGYVCLSVADWDGDGLNDIMINNTLGRIFWFRNIGTRTKARLQGPLDVEVEWKGEQPELGWGWIKSRNLENPKSIMTQWRTTPVMTDWDGDGLVDLILSDTEGYVCLWRRSRNHDGSLRLNPPERVFFREDGKPFRHNAGRKGHSGRSKFCVVDWDGDGKMDILQNSNNARWWRQVRDENGKWYFRDMGSLAPNWIQWHSTSPCTADFNADGIPDLVCTGEDGLFYYMRNPRTILAKAEASWVEPKQAPRKNLLVNPSFEQVGDDGMPSGWRVKIYKGKNPFKTGRGYGMNGSGGVKYANDDLSAFASLKQRVKVRPGGIYSFECRIKPENLKCNGEGAVSTIEWHDAKGRRLGGTVVPNAGIRGCSKQFSISRPRKTPRLPAEAATVEISIFVNPDSKGVCYFDDACFWESTPVPVDALTSDSYRNAAADGDVTFFAGLDLASSALDPRNVRGIFTFLSADAKKRVSREASSVETYRARLTVPVKQLAMGSNKVEFRLEERRTGKVLGASSMTFERVETLPARKVYFDRHGRTIVDGKPFFPLGMFSSGMEHSNVVKYAESAFNFVMPYRRPTKAEMDDLWAHGIRVAYDLRNGVLGWTDTEKNIKTSTDELFWMLDKVTEYGAHPGLLAWYTNDEFDLAGIKHLTVLYRVLAELDPQHPAVTCIYQVPNTRGYLPSFDVIGTDPYPIDEAPISLVTDWTRKTRKGVMGSRPLWQVPQMFDWAYYRRKSGGSLEGLRFPTREEMENMAWQAVASGANGLLFYSFHDVFRDDPSKADERWEDVKKVALAIKAHEATLLCVGDVPVISGETDTIAARAYSDNEKLKVLVVNAARKAQKANLFVGKKSLKVELAPMESKWIDLK